MGLSLKSEHLKRYKDIAWLLMKYGRSDVVKRAGLEEAIEVDESFDEGVPAEAEELATDLERMGPTFIKLAQLLSTRADLLPPPYLHALTRLQDKVEPFSFGEVEQIVSTELGVRMSKAFAEFEATPVAAASLGQVHRAWMRDGRAVVVKVQRPGIRESIAQDLEAMSSIAEFLDAHTEAGSRYEFQPMLEEFRKSLLRELDYRSEARHLHTFAQNLRDFERIVVPLPIEDYTTSRVLTMDYISGKKITTLTPLAHIELDGYLLAEHLFHAYLQQMLVDGFFHADPHPGNVFLTDSGSIALIDLGMVSWIAPRLQDTLLQMLLAISEGRGDEAAEIAIRVGSPKENFDDTRFRRHVADLVVQHREVQIENIDAGRAVLEITRISGECGFRLPPEFTMIGKTLLNLDQVVHTLDPKFDPNYAIRQYSSVIMQHRIRRSFSPGNLFGTVLEMKDMLEKLPTRVNRLLDAISNNEVEIKIDAIDETKLMEGFQKVANRITLGLVLAALIVGAAMLTRVETSFRLFGYPGLAIILFLIAAGGALVLAFNILFYDERKR
ncbi:MAG TPA: AarF/UbiB family protein [Pyrinomonadaceae bacterium]|jgi:predicted unusual protein kinase regulating ubiquinone biosynthesis (AarF/ABC1/UbiB family)